MGRVGDGATRAVQAAQEAELDRVPSRLEDDWNRRCRSFGCEGGWCGSRSDHGYLLAHQISRQLRQPIVFTLRPAVFDCHVLTFDITSFFQTAKETGHEPCERTRRCAVKEPDHPHRRLLRPRRERPYCRCTAEQRDELAPPHVWHGLSFLPFWREPMSYSTSRSACRRALGESLGQT